MIRGDRSNSIPFRSKFLMDLFDLWDIFVFLTNKEIECFKEVRQLALNGSKGTF